MGAYVVGKRHIDFLMGAALLWGAGPNKVSYWQPAESRRIEVTRGNVNDLGAMLWRENALSVGYRYEETPRDTTYTYQTPAQRIPPHQLPVHILKAVAGLEYQSCEHPGWETSDAKRLCDALRDAAINHLPGYEAAEWTY